MASFIFLSVPSLSSRNSLHAFLAVAEHQGDIFIELFIIATKLCCWVAVVISEIIVL